MVTVTLRVEGMTCGGCEQSVCRAVEQVPGVSHATADHTTGVVSLSMLESADIVAVRDAILDAGFTAGAMSGPRA
ncbi:MAG: heavy-metal-associated protein [Chloroflexi bacterium]|nr:heavy-metal-associated protein [Chloroflexota bacterium]